MIDVLYFANSVVVLFIISYIFTYYLQLNRYEFVETIRITWRSCINLLIYYLLIDIVDMAMLIILGNADMLIVFALTYICRLILSIYYIRKNIIKNRLRFTPRVIRFCIINIAVFITCILLISDLFNNFVVHIAVVLVAYFISFSLSKIIEYFIAKSYIYATKKKLRKYPDLKVIGVTGSYGKTSVKHILCELLQTKYICMCTPLSYNTPMGICKYIRSINLSGVEYLIVEMGATKCGDIKFICDIVDPDYAILTNVGEQHLNSFKTLENIIKTKMELIDYVNNKKGLSVVNCNNGLIRKVCEIYLSLIRVYVNNAKENDNKCKCIVNNVKKDIFVSYINNIDKNGTKFKFCDICNNVVGYLSTMLLGEHNVLNISLAVSLSLILGLEMIDVANVVSKLQPVPNRMELKVGLGGASIIMDAYNSNSYSFKQMIETVKNFDSNRKILITPGVVELGKVQHSVNRELAIKASHVFDEIWVINKVNKYAYIEGVGDCATCQLKCFDKLDKNIFDTVNVLQSDTLVVFENDLPDSYK